jgi:molybdate transport system ATP-binding protein
MTLSVRARHRQGDFVLDAAFESSGSLTALFGPSGSGKTSLVNIIGGLIRPAAARIEIAGRVLVDTQARVFVPKHRRRIGYVFQDARLFPHLSVRRNLTYGRFFTPSSERYAEFDGVVDLLGIGHLLARKPASLSGGEKQRVAIGRALIASPKLMLMDEPLASLDDARKAEILPYIERLRDETKIPIVYVSHSVGEVFRLATDVVVMKDGHVAASGAAADILARFDLLPEEERGEAGTLIDLTLAVQDDGFGLSVLRSAGGEWRLPRVDQAVGSTLRARVRARDVMLATERPAGVSALNVLAGTVTAISAGQGPDALVTLDCRGDRLAARITRRSVDMLGLTPGRSVFAVVKAVTFDRGSITGAYQP